MEGEEEEALPAEVEEEDEGEGEKVSSGVIFLLFLSPLKSHDGILVNYSSRGGCRDVEEEL